jgi:putative endonuclease
VADRKQTGRDGEKLAADYLEQRGYTIVMRNYRIQRGEIDIIAHKEGTTVFAEVKSLPSGGIETLSHELDARKQKRIVETAKSFLSLYRQYSDDYIRFDVLIVNTPGFDPVCHIENAFLEQI